MLGYKNNILLSIPENNSSSKAFLNIVFFTLAQVDLDRSTILINAKSDLGDKIKKVLSSLYPNADVVCWEDNILINDAASILNDCHVEDVFNIENFKTEAERKTILKTIFIINGRLYFTKNELKNSLGYLLEFTVKDSDSADLVMTLLGEFNFEFKKKMRQNNFVIYTKNSNTICDLLVLLGDSRSALEIQNNLAMREVRNTLNRQNNCFESNLNKTINKSVEQVEAINYIIDHHSIDYLSENLKEVALARMFNPDVSLNELKTLLNNKISRAGIKYRLDKIVEIYKQLKGEK